MRSVQASMWDARPPSKHASPPRSNSRPANVTTAAPAKRITFYKSGDSRFGGIRMAVHKRSFKCFDTLLDDLSQKMPLPFGVRTVTTPRGTHTIQHLEQLQDGGCYLCSDRRQAKPIDMELASRRPNTWYHHSHRPHPPETPPRHLPFRQRRILLVKNGEPGTRRSVVLSRRSARSLRAFLGEVSEVMQFHVRKLYTADGRRVDSVQGLMTCPGALVCVGREAFSPTVANVNRKSSEEKLPSLGSKSPGLGPRTPGNGARSPATQGARSPPHGSQSRASEQSEGQESKKNVNFGLETKKSIIHPRSDSSNRSTHPSMSSEKSHGVGAGACSRARPTIANDDIEKRVLVNKDGSLSVEMRVRFRLQNDETLRWSTQVRKSPSLSNECCPLSQAQHYYQQQGQSESCSNPDSASFDSSQPPHVSEGKHCACCYQRQERQYDLWENPVHSHSSPVPPPHTPSHTHTIRRHTHSSSSSSSCHSRRVVRCRARLSNCRGGSVSGQSRLVREEVCVTEQVERRVEVEQGGDTRVEVRRVSRCCSRSEVVAVDGDSRPLHRKSVEDELTMEDAGERPPSAISSSSNVLQSLKEDQDDDLSFTASQCCHSDEPSPSLTVEGHLMCKPTGDVTAGSAASSCRCGAATPRSTAGDRASCRSSRARTQTSEEDGAADDEYEEMKRVASGSSGRTAGSHQSGASSVCPNCGGCKCDVNSVSNSRASQRSRRSRRASPTPATPLSNQEDVNTGIGDDGSGVSAVSAQSKHSNHTNHGRLSAVPNVPEGRASSVRSTTATGKEDGRAPRAASATSHRSDRSHESGLKAEKERSPSAVSARSGKSHKSNSSGRAAAPDIGTREEAEGELTVDRARTSLSAKSGASSRTSASVVVVASPTVEEDVTNRRIPRPDSVLSAKSAKSNVSAKSGTSHMSARSHRANAASPAADEPVKSSVESSSCHELNSPQKVQSVPSNTNVVIDTPVSVDGEGSDGAERAPSSASAISRNSNVSSASSQKSSHNRAADVAVERVADEKEGGATKSQASEDSHCPSLSVTRTCTPRTPSLRAPATPSSGPQSPVRRSPAGSGVGEARGLSALSVHSLKSAKSSGSKRRCGAAPEKKADEEVKSEASSTQRQRRESGGTEQPLSRRSSGSVSLGLPEDQETAESDSGMSSVSCHVNTQRAKTASPDVSNRTEAPTVKDNAEGTGSAASRRSDKNGGDVGSSANPPAADIPTIETTDERNETGASSAKSSRSCRSSCTCSVKAAALMSEAGSVKSDPAIKAGSNTDTPNDRVSSVKSSVSSKVCGKSPASVKKSTKTTPDDSATDADNKEASVHSKSPRGLKPESAASAQSEPLNPIKGQKAESRGSAETSGSGKKEKQVKSSSPCLLHGSRPHSRAGTCSESTLSHSLSAADLLKETVAAERPRSRTSGKARSGKSQRSRKQADPEELDLTPACLPNASPNEVVSDWLRSIPADGGVLGLGDEGTPGGEAAKGEERSPEGETVDEGETAEAEGEKGKEDAECDAAESPPRRPKALLLSGDSLPRNWHSSAAVMKVLLSSSMGRCRSLPEVSPVYGRRLSTSARGFLDCLAQLQLIEPAVSPEQKSHRYEDIMAILQSLWLTEPRRGEAKETKDVGTEQMSPPRSSSGVDVSSGSGSGRENANRGGEEKGQNKSSEAESLREDEGVERVVAGEEEEEEEGGNAEEEDKDANTEPAVELERSGDQSAAPPSLDSPKATENPSSSDKSSAHGSSKSPTDNERETLEDSSSGTPSTVTRAPVSKRPSQDPDPVWILQLLKKLEGQFMDHYSSAMAEFKVRWDLDDSLVLDAMIAELRDEVSRRIQSSVEREMKKIHGRAGRTGRPAQPPKGGDLSRESTMTEKRRQMLRVMKNQSVKTADSLSDGETAADFSDQRSDDEYCPCDACVRKKMAARPLKVNPLAAEAPVMMEFDLLKILQLKRSPSPAAAPPAAEEGGGNVAADREGRSLEVVQEEEEDETKEDIRAYVVLEETIQEEDEDIEKEDEGEAGEDKEVEEGGEESSVADEEQEVGEMDGEAGETSDKVVEEADPDKAGSGEEGERADDEERVGEDAEVDGETGNEEEAEGSDKETLKGETSEDGDEVSEPKPEGDEQTSGRGSGGEENEEEDDAARNASNDKEFAGDEDDGGDDSGEGGVSDEQEREAPEEEGTSPRGQVVTGGEEAGAEDSDADGKRPSDTDVDEDEDKVKHEEGDQRDDGALLHQFTRTSVESQPGSMEDIDADSSPNSVKSMEVPKATGGGGGGAGQRRSRSPARVKRRKPKERDEELDF